MRPKARRRTVTLASGQRAAATIAGPPDAPAICAFAGAGMSGKDLAALWTRPDVDVQLILPDRPGLGDSEPYPDHLRPRGLSDFDAFHAELLDRLGVGQVVAAGHSLGGAMAMHFAHAYPDRATGLVSFDNPPIHLRPVSALPFGNFDRFADPTVHPRAPTATALDWRRMGKEFGQIDSLPPHGILFFRPADTNGPDWIEPDQQQGAIQTRLAQRYGLHSIGAPYGHRSLHFPHPWGLNFGGYGSDPTLAYLALREVAHAAADGRAIDLEELLNWQPGLFIAHQPLWPTEPAPPRSIRYLTKDLPVPAAASERADREDADQTPIRAPLGTLPRRRTLPPRRIYATAQAVEIATRRPEPARGRWHLSP